MSEQEAQDEAEPEVEEQGPPPLEPVPPRVGIALEVATRFHVCAPGEQVSDRQRAAVDAAFLVLTRYMIGEHDFKRWV